MCRQQLLPATLFHLDFFFSLLSLIFPRWDAIAIILSMFLMTYTYIEAKSNYHRGSILILRSVHLCILASGKYVSLIVSSYGVLLAGFYFAPPTALDVTQGHLNDVLSTLQEIPALSWTQTARWYSRSLF